MRDLWERIPPMARFFLGFLAICAVAWIIGSGGYGGGYGSDCVPTASPYSQC